MTDATRLLTLSPHELDHLFHTGTVGEIPDGPARGTAIIAPGTRHAPLWARLVRWMLWQGKVFDAKNGVLKNRVLPVHLECLQARVYKAQSWHDGKECIVLDYHPRNTRDELRQIGPCLFLGTVYDARQRRRRGQFCLEFGH